MIVKIMPALLLVVFFLICVRTKYNPIYTYLQYAVLACVFVRLNNIIFTKYVIIDS